MTNISFYDLTTIRPFSQGQICGSGRLVRKTAGGLFEVVAATFDRSLTPAEGQVVLGDRVGPPYQTSEQAIRAAGY